MPRLISRSLTGLMAVVLWSRAVGAGGRGTEARRHSSLAYEAFVSGLQTVGFDSLGMAYKKGGPFQDWTWTWMYRGTYVCAGNRWRQKIHDVGFHLDECVPTAQLGTRGRIRREVLLHGHKG